MNSKAKCTSVGEPCFLVSKSEIDSLIRCYTSPTLASNRHDQVSLFVTISPPKDTLSLTRHLCRYILTLSELFVILDAL